MSDSISIDVGSMLTYLEGKILALIGRDEMSREFRAIIDAHLKLALRDASIVQIAGMDTPVPVADIYQPTTLRQPYRRDSVPVSTLLRESRSAIIFGGPGAGKTMLLHHVFAATASSAIVVPLLFTLRRADAASDLEQFVSHLRRKPAKGDSSLLLLVDGYDEVSTDERRRVDAALTEYLALNVGMFLLTCRSFVEPGELKAERVIVSPFTESDAERFITAFSKAYRAPLDAVQILHDLRKAGIDDFVRSPLMLALVCILKSGPMPDLPRSPVRLIGRALDTLTWRWDESRGVSRENRVSIDGTDRVNCLMMVAYGMENVFAPQEQVRQLVTRFLKNIHREDVRWDVLLTEIAQWYGIFIPLGENEWTFAHKSLHDYLAAKYMLETGRFKPGAITEWNSRAAYAAAMSADATQSMRSMLRHSDDIAVFAECMSNQARFNADEVVPAFVQRLSQNRSYSAGVVNGELSVTIREDVFAAAPLSFLMAAIRFANERHEEARDVTCAYALSEVVHRDVPVSSELLQRLKLVFGSDMTFAVRRQGVVIRVHLSQLRTAENL